MNRILIVDDEEPVCMLYKEYLTREGYRVDTVNSGRQAMHRIGEITYDLMVLDVELANENGLDILKQIKKKYPDLPVILNSAYSVYKSDFTSWMADAYLLKSSDINPLIDKVRKYLGVPA